MVCVRGTPGLQRAARGFFVRIHEDQAPHALKKRWDSWVYILRSPRTRLAVQWIWGGSQSEAKRTSWVRACAGLIPRTWVWTMRPTSTSNRSGARQVSGYHFGQAGTGTWAWWFIDYRASSIQNDATWVLSTCRLLGVVPANKMSFVFLFYGELADSFFLTSPLCSWLLLGEAWFQWAYCTTCQVNWERTHTVNR